MAPILSYGVAASSMSGYSARPDSSDHEAYGIGHMLYIRSPCVGLHRGRMGHGSEGILRTERAVRRRARDA
ncbi:hypothetical protein Stsp02_73470 [Streptomyces sp. NBRC 14336]|nr:hypothetical protein Stsp02_73470 [Streptomyces sp. NBRC 14336]